MLTMTEKLRVQRGTTVLTAGQTLSVTIREVEPEYASINVVGYNTANAVSAIITGATTISVYSAVAGSVSWEVRG